MKKKSYNRILVYIIPLIILSIIILFLQCHTSKVLNTNNVTIYNFLDLMKESIVKTPFDLLHFNLYGLLWWLIILLYIVMLIQSNNKPTADSNWRDIEHGSNRFQTKQDIKVFLKERTDEQVPLYDEEMENIIYGENKEK